jgi:adenine-specific DNA-methyltransferase
LDGKSDVVNHHKKIPYKTIECKEEIGDIDTQNMIIKGDNLLALKSLLPYYASSVKMIYIDPPYNTGNTSWVYNDNMDSPLIKKWLEKTVNAEDLSRSDKWLCMMYPRLKLLRELLKEDGVIFISINDAEVAHLRMICDEIFGRNNFITELIWNSEGNTDNQLEIKINHEYILVYIKNSEYKNIAIGNVIDPNTKEDSNLWQGIADNNINKNSPANPPSIITLPVGFPCKEKELIYKKVDIDEDFFEITSKEKIISEKIKDKYKLGKKDGLPVKLDDMIVQDYKLVQPCRIYGGFANKNKLLAFIEHEMQPMDDDGNILRFYLNSNCAVRYHKEKKSVRNILSVLKNLGTTEKMKTVLKTLNIDFSYPKPLDLIRYLIEIGTGNENNAIILDSFAGSGTTGNAVLEVNKMKKMNHRFILIEMEEYAHNVTAKRLKAVIDKYDDGFKYCELSEDIFDEFGELNPKLTFAQIAKHIYFVEFKKPICKDEVHEPYVGEYEKRFIYFFENRFKVADMKKIIKEHKKYKQIIIYTKKTAISEDELKNHNITVRYIPYDIKDN